MMNNPQTLPLLHYDLGKNIVAFTTLRQGGVSEGNYASFNINPYCGDNPEHVAINRQLLAETLGVEPEKIILPHQTHSNNVAFLDEAFLAEQEGRGAKALENIDAVICPLKGFCVGVSTADCVPILLYDEKHHIGAAIHAGWRGVVADIVGSTIQRMESDCQVDASNLGAVIAPCIGLPAFEVGEEVYDYFSQAQFPMDRIASRINNRWHIDLVEAVAYQLEGRGVLSHSIFRSNECTYSAPDRFFSARQLGINSGRLFTGFILN